MKDSAVQNQSYLRYINQKTIIKYLRKESLSCADLAKRMKLSNTAIAKITDELVRCGILIKQESKSQDVGRRPILMQINPAAGVVYAVNLAGRQITACISDLSGETLCETKLPITGKITKQQLYGIIDTLKDMHNTFCGNLKLLSVCVAAPGKIDLSTGNFLLAHRFSDYKNINLKEMFSQSFSCEAMVYNDIKLAFEGERIYGTALASVKNAVMLYIDNSVGSALMFGENIYNGCHGFAGELTNYSLNALSDSGDMFFPQSVNNLDSLSLDGIVNIIRQYCPHDSILLKGGGKPADISLENILSSYAQNDAFTVNIIGQTAMIWARILRNMAEFLDIEVIVLSGDIVKFGDGFKDTVENYINSSLQFQDIRVIYSEFAGEGALMGCISAAINKALACLLKNV